MLGLITWMCRRLSLAERGAHGVDQVVVVRRRAGQQLGGGTGDERREHPSVLGVQRGPLRAGHRRHRALRLGDVPGRLQHGLQPVHARRRDQREVEAPALPVVCPLVAVAQGPVQGVVRGPGAFVVGGAGAGDRRPQRGPLQHAPHQVELVQLGRGQAATV